MEGKNSSEKTPSIGCTKSRGVTSILLSTTLTNGPRVRRLVLAEKFSAARRLAQILSEGKTARVRADGITYFQFSRQGDEYTLFPLRGHVVEIDYPADVQDWKSTDLDYLIDLEPVRHESPPALHNMLRLLADATDEVILATDYDREGELIGVEALETLRSRRTELPAKRARFSAMSPSEVRRSFENLTEPDWALAEAAAARQRNDLAPREGLPRGNQRGPCDGRGPGPLRPRGNQLPADGQHGLPSIAPSPRPPAASARLSLWRLRRPAPGAAHPRSESRARPDDGPSAHLSDSRAGETAGQRPFADVRPNRPAIPRDLLASERDRGHGRAARRRRLRVRGHRARPDRSGMEGNPAGTRSSESPSSSFGRRRRADPGAAHRRRADQATAPPLAGLPPARDATARTRHEVHPP